MFQFWNGAAIRANADYYSAAVAVANYKIYLRHLRIRDWLLVAVTLTGEVYKILQCKFYIQLQFQLLLQVQLSLILIYLAVTFSSCCAIISAIANGYFIIVIIWTILIEIAASFLYLAKEGWFTTVDCYCHRAIAIE